MAKRLTTEQRANVQAAIIMGSKLDEFAARHRDWPQADLEDFWKELAAEINSTQLEPGQYWGIPSEWV